MVALHVRGRLAKPSSICLGAFDEKGPLAGYLIVSRYVDAWHVMNLAVDLDHRRAGVANRLLDALFDLTAGDEHRGYTLEVGSPTRPPSPSTSATASRRAACVVVTTPTIGKML